jgi:hypothetical protein
MEYYSAIKKNESVSSAGKWMELKIIMLHKKKSHVQKINIACFLAYAESRHKKYVYNMNVNIGLAGKG